MTMKKNIIKTWADVKLYQLQELEGLGEYENQIDLIVEQLSILMEMDPSEVENMAVTDLMIEIDKWKFIKEKTTQGKRIDLFKIEGKRFGFIKLDELTLGQMVDIEFYVGNGLMKNAHKIMSVLYLPVKKYNLITKKYTLEEYSSNEDRQNLFKLVTMDVLYPQMLFFWNIVKIYLKDIESSFETKMNRLTMKMEMNNMTMDQKQATIQNLTNLQNLTKNGIGLI